MTAVWYCPMCRQEGDDSRRIFCPEDGAKVRPIAERGAEWIGKILAEKYRVLRFVGSGGMADVFEVERMLSGKRLALKILHSEHSGNERLSERFRQEAVLISLIAHPNVVNLLDFGTLKDNTNFMVMELLSGRSLKEALAAGPLSPPEACRIMLQVSEGMAAAHERGVIHRDIKPDNIFLQDNGPGNDPVVKILDLGIGRLFTTPKKRLTNAGTLLGTPEYMSPEQCNGEEAGIPSDIYAMGVVLYELLMGFLPFKGSSFLMTLSMHAAEEPVWHHDVALERDLPAEAEAVVIKALSKKPADRHESMLEFQRDVAGILSRLRHGDRYSLVAPAPETSRPAAQTPSTAVRIATLTDAKGNNREAVLLANDTYWVGTRHNDEMECNAYLRIFRGDTQTLSMLIDPGPLEDLEIVAAKAASVIGALENLNYIFLSHPSEDAAGSVAEIQRINPNAFLVCSGDTRRLLKRGGTDPKRYIPEDSFPGRRMAFSTGHALILLPTPFCYFRGSVMAYDPEQSVLFSGSLFSSISKGIILSNAQNEDGIVQLHQLIMPDKEAVLRAVKAVQKLDPPPKIIAPQHGALLRGEEIQKVLSLLAGLRLGIDLFDKSTSPPKPKVLSRQSGPTVTTKSISK